ncbi:MAG: sigma-70 family RNA polymerase sigma factor [Caldilineaceae bacterium]
MRWGVEEWRSRGVEATERVFRAQYGEVLATLLRFGGYQHFDLAEEAVQTAFQRALEKWPEAGEPQNPVGWLYTVARNAYLETLRRARTEQTKLAQLHEDATLRDADFATMPEAAEVSAPPDELAAMILLCCNPELNPKAQLCLTLKSVCGFSVKEIARALGMQEEAAKKTITRAKAKVAEQADELRSLNPSRIAARFQLVLDVIYAMFNEGYAASGGPTQLRRDVAEDAIRLGDIFVQSALTPAERQGELQALLALMLFQFARFDARTDERGAPIRLQEQDRSRWNRALIRAALLALESSRSSVQVTALHIEARIAAQHAASPTFAQTDWSAILALYDQLLHYKESPEVRLSRIVALRHAQGWQPALGELDQMQADTLARSFLLHAIRADLLEAAGQPNAAAAEWQKARLDAPTAADRLFIDQKLKEL